MANKRRWMLQMRCCADVAKLPSLLYDGGYPDAREMLGAPNATAVLSHLNLLPPISTSSIWDGWRWPTTSTTVSLVDPTHPLANNGTYQGGDREGLLTGGGVDETGCLVLPLQPCLSVLLFWSSREADPAHPGRHPAAHVIQCASTMLAGCLAGRRRLPPLPPASSRRSSAPSSPAPFALKICAAPGSRPARGSSCSA